MWILYTQSIPEVLDLPPSMGTFSKRHFNKREIWSLKDVGGSAHGLWQKILTDYKFNNTPLLRQHVLSAATIHPFINAQKCWFMYPLLFNTGRVVLKDKPNLPICFTSHAAPFTRRPGWNTECNINIYIITSSLLRRKGLRPGFSIVAWANFYKNAKQE